MMLYFKTSQAVPGKGNAWTYYECQDDKSIVRYVTHITGTDEVECVTDPIIKQFYRPELLEPSSKEEFEQYWPHE